MVYIKGQASDDSEHDDDNIPLSNMNLDAFDEDEEKKILDENDKNSKTVDIHNYWCYK